jgi:hypothetical protein
MKAIIIAISVFAAILAGCAAPAPAAPVQQQPQTQQPLSASPKIGVAPQSITLEFTEGQTKTVTKTLTILNEGGGVMQWAATKSQPWIWMTDATGALEKGFSKNLDVNVAASGMAVGTYQDNISIEGVGATNSPFVVKVTMVVKAAPPPVSESGSTQVRKAAPPPPWDYNEWTNDTYKLRFRYPKEYVVKTIAGAAFGAVANNGKPNSDVIMMSIEGSYGVSYLDTITEFSKDAIRSVGGKPNPKIISNDNTTTLADGVTPAFEVVIDSKSSTTQSYECYIFGFQKSNRFIFFGGCTPLTYAADRMELWKQMGRTLEMTN